MGTAFFERVWLGEEAYEETLRVHMARAYVPALPRIVCKTERGQRLYVQIPDRHHRGAK
jgi:hypothetical protein